MHHESLKPQMLEKKSSCYFFYKLITTVTRLGKNIFKVREMQKVSMVFKSDLNYHQRGEYKKLYQKLSRVVTVYSR